MGSRYGGLKQLDPVGPSGETLMDYSIYDAKRAGFTRVVFLIRREMRDLFEEQVGRKYQGILEVDYAYQEKDDLPGDFACPPEREKPWGTGHAVWAAREALQGSSFAVINADDFYGAETFTELMKAFSAQSSTEGLLECGVLHPAVPLRAQTATERGLTNGEAVSIVQRHAEANGDADRVDKDAHIRDGHHARPIGVAPIADDGGGGRVAQTLHAILARDARERNKRSLCEWNIPVGARDQKATNDEVMRR